MPTYDYAFDENQNIVAATSLERINGKVDGTFRCIGCNKIMVPKLGKQVAKHFAHESVADSCGTETYLHYLAKQTFFDEYNRCLEHNEPFYIKLRYAKKCYKFEDFNQKGCPIDWFERQWDLLETFNAIAMEKRDGEFVPDLLLYNNQRPELKLYIEIYVTHMLSEKKAASPNRIVEININEEKDIQCILERCITEEHASFQNLTIAPGVCDAECQCINRFYWSFYVYKSGKTYMDQSRLPEIYSKRELSNTIVYSKILTKQKTPLDEEPYEIMMMFLKQAIYDGQNIKNCHLCIHKGHSGFARENCSIYCDETGESGKGSMAIDCDLFELIDDITPYERT